MTKLKLNSWLIPIIISFVFIVVASPALADLIDNALPASAYLIDQVGSETIDGHQRVFVVAGGQKNFISDPSYNSFQATSSADYVAYVGQIEGAGQIFLYHGPTNSTLKVTDSSTNQKPRVTPDGKLAWERWIGNHWEVFYYDGAVSRPLTPGETTLNPKIDGQFLIFAKRLPSGQWASIAYSLADNTFQDIFTGPQAKDLPVSDGRLTLPSGENISLTSAFNLGLGALAVPESPATVSAAVIESELSPEITPTPSPIPEPTITPSPTEAPTPTDTPTATPSESPTPTL